MRRPGVRRFILHPSSFILPLALLAAVLLWPALQAGLLGTRPHIDRSAATPIPAPPAAPELSWLLEQRQALALSAGQVEKLRRLQSRWERESRSLRVALEQETAALNREMADRPAAGLNVQQFQERTASLSELSRRLAEARGACWKEAAPLLTAAQRQQAEEAWTTRLAGGRQTSPPQ